MKIQQFQISKVCSTSGSYYSYEIFFTLLLLLLLLLLFCSLLCFVFVLVLFIFVLSPAFYLSNENSYCYVSFKTQEKKTYTHSHTPEKITNTTETDYDNKEKKKNYKKSATFSNLGPSVYFATFTNTTWCNFFDIQLKDISEVTTAITRLKSVLIPRKINHL